MHIHIHIHIHIHVHIHIHIHKQGIWGGASSQDGFLRDAFHRMHRLGRASLARADGAVTKHIMIIIISINIAYHYYHY